MIRDIFGRDMSAALDRYITGNYGEDQFRGEDEMDELITCDRCGEDCPEDEAVTTELGTFCSDDCADDEAAEHDDVDEEG